MIGHADVEKLPSMRAPGPAVLSLYLPVPPGRAGVRGLAAPAEDLMARAGAGGPGGASIATAGRRDRGAVPGALAAHGRDWLGHTVAFSPASGVPWSRRCRCRALCRDVPSSRHGRMSGRCSRRYSDARATWPPSSTAGTPGKELITAGAVPVRKGIQMTVCHPHGQPIEHAASRPAFGGGMAGRAGDRLPGRGRLGGGS